MARGPLVVKLGSSTLVDGRGPRAAQRLDGSPRRSPRCGPRTCPSASSPPAPSPSGSGALPRGAARASSCRRPRPSARRCCRRRGPRWPRRARAAPGAADGRRRTPPRVVRERPRHARDAARWGIVPVVNENDSTATRRDHVRRQRRPRRPGRGAAARALAGASDRPRGPLHLATRPPGAELVREVRDHRCSGARLGRRGSRWGSGGMRSKVVAAEMARAGGVASVIAHGAHAGVVGARRPAEPVGTRFAADAGPVSAYKLLAALRQARHRPHRRRRRRPARAGRGRRVACCRSASPRVNGRFARRRRVEIAGPDGVVFAKGIARGSAPPTSAAPLGKRGRRTAVHRDELVVFGHPLVDCADRRAPVSCTPCHAHLRATSRPAAARPRASLRGPDTGSQGRRPPRDRRRAAGRPRRRSSRRTPIDVAEAVAKGTSSRPRRPADARRAARWRRSPRRPRGRRRCPTRSAGGRRGRRPNGLEIDARASRSAGSLVVYEARPNVTVDAACLHVKSGKCRVLRGSSWRPTNRALLDPVRTACATAGLPVDAVQELDADRDELAALRPARQRRGRVPRGGEALKHFLLDHSRIPVLAAGRAATATCTSTRRPTRRMADPDRGQRQDQRPGVCNATETLLVQPTARRPAASCCGALRRPWRRAARSSEPRAARPRSLPASEADWARRVPRPQARGADGRLARPGVEHIDRPGTGHSEAIVTERQACRRVRAGSTPPACTSTPPPASPTAASTAWAPRSATPPRACTPAARSHSPS